MSRRFQRRTEEHEFMLAQLTSCIVNFSMAHPKEAVQAKDFMPSEMRKRAAMKPERINRKQVAAETRSFFAALRGKQGQP